MVCSPELAISLVPLEGADRVAAVGVVTIGPFVGDCKMEEVMVRLVLTEWVL